MPPAVLLSAIVSSFVLMLALAVYIFCIAPISAPVRIIYFGLVSALFYCSIVYLVNRFGSSLRNADFQPVTEAQRDDLIRTDAPSVTVLVPSYREERRVVLMTVLSAALSHYPRRNIVVLVDDPLESASRPETLAAIDELKQLLREPMMPLQAAAAAWQVRRQSGAVEAGAEVKLLVHYYQYAADWLTQLAGWLETQISPEFAHVDTFLKDRVVLDLAAHYQAHADALRETMPDLAKLDREYLRLGTLFCTDISSFERKRFANLSHARNKAMNLNAYLGLLGGTYAAVESAAGMELQPAADGPIVVPKPDYVLTLDADSVILSDYILELVGVIEARPEVGVVQTPYRTFPGSRTAVERIAGATTDLQYLIHQGSSRFGAAYWVGANALLRFSALEQIATTREVEGRREKVYIADTTVIEDTGSTIDLLEAGWRVHNHPRQLAYSATPADFGSLTVQRQRWSNGGLIIYPALLRQYFTNPGRWRRTVELLLRTHYLLSPIIGNTAVFALMVMIGVEARSLVWAPLAMFPYFLIYALDLKRNGYRMVDLFAVSSLNLLLMPVNFAGILASIGQIVTGRKGAFARTPKVVGRTRVLARYIVFNLAMPCLLATYVVSGLAEGEVLGSVMPAVSLCLYVYGIHRYIGLANAADDLLTAARDRILGIVRARRGVGAGGGE